MKQKTKEQGITLIALVVTIIILLILAGVAINMALGDNGLFKKSKEAVNTWKSAEENEAGVLGYLDIEWQNLINGNTNKENEITLIEMYKKAQEDNCMDGKTCTKPEEHIHVGDYITNYNDTLKNKSATVTLKEEQTGIVGTQTYNIDSSTTWRILGLNEEKTQLIITTGSPIKKSNASGFSEEQIKINQNGKDSAENDPYLYLFGPEGWYNTNDEMTNNNILDQICNIYDSKYASKISSIRMEDINYLLEIEIDKNEKKIYKKHDETKTNIGEITDFFEKTYTYKSKDHAPENYLKEKYPENQEYQALQSKKIGDKVTGTAYTYSIENENIINKSSKLYEILFNETTKESNYKKAYWIAFTGTGIFDEYCRFGTGAVRNGSAGAGGIGYNSYGNCRMRWFGVRPIVYLNSNITRNELKVEQNIEEEWTSEILSSEDKIKLEYGEIKN